jgi:hypothetical protein
MGLVMFWLTVIPLSGAHLTTKNHNALVLENLSLFKKNVKKIILLTYMQ